MEVYVWHDTYGRHWDVLEARLQELQVRAEARSAGEVARQGPSGETALHCSLRWVRFVCCKLAGWRDEHLQTLGLRPPQDAKPEGAALRMLEIGVACGPIGRFLLSRPARQRATADGMGIHHYCSAIVFIHQ